ncbi:MAG: selenocysteine-specific elongation factor [Paraglaciecola psychrophila]
MIVATAGHVDHGKTSLIKQLTGVDTDRLEEEKRRGLSINLGFAYRPLGADKVLGFIDVPGHSRFINTMIAGVGGIDIGLLVVAADDGPMPQTKEHLAVLQLMGVRDYILVVTKIDRVAAARVTQVGEQLKALVGAAAPLFALSNTSGEGVAALQQHLDRAALGFEQRTGVGHFRLSVDRAFSIKGSGLVVTGTVSAGQVAVGDSLLLQPQGVAVRVRGIHAQDQSAAIGVRGQRCALNLSGAIERDAIGRGSMLVAPALSELSDRCAVRLQLLASAPFKLKHLSPVKIHLGAGRYAAKLLCLEAPRSLGAGSSTLAQLVFDEPLSICRGDRFILRDDSESISLGGGVILNPVAEKPQKNSPQSLLQLRALEHDSPLEVLQQLLIEQGGLLNFEQFKRSWNIRDDEQSVMHELPFLLRGPYIIGAQRWQSDKAQLLEQLQQWHRHNPLREGVAPTELRGDIDQPLYAALITELISDGAALLRGGALTASGHRVATSPQQMQQWSQLEQALNAAENPVPLRSELQQLSGLSDKDLNSALRAAVKLGDVRQIADKRYAKPTALQAYTTAVLQLGEAGAAFTVVQFKGASGCSRNLAIELLEYFDKIRFTQRRGNERIILDVNRADG